MLLVWPSVAWAGGWYLLTAPVFQERSGTWTVALDAPLRVWQQRQAFDSALDCEAFFGQVVGPTKSEVTRLVRKLWRTEAEELQLARLFADENARCVSSDDPRLK